MKLNIPKNKNNKTSKQVRGDTSEKGFTIIETLVAIFILLIVTTGPLAFAQSGLRASFLARDQITAFYLAQEAIEIIKNARDTNQLLSLSESDWLSDSIGSCDPGEDSGGSAICNIHVTDVGNNLVVNHSDCEGNTGSKCVPLNYDDTTKQFVLSDGDSVSKYTRTVYLDMINNYELQIIVEVSWESNLLTAPKRIVVQENIFKR
jgi:prepilin-type N-terminal cleavage/methylation domain-containing protein